MRVFALTLILTSSLGIGNAAAIPGRDPATVVADPSTAARTVHERGEYPSNLYTPSGDEGSLTPLYGDEVIVAPARKAPPDVAPEESSNTVRVGSRQGSGVLSLIVLVGAIAVMVFFLVWLLIATAGRHVPGREGRTKAVTYPARRAAAPNTEPEPPLDPERLADEGRFLDAIVALLERALLETGWRPVGKARSQTAREVLAMVSHDDPRRPLLERVVFLAEALRFGGLPADSESFQRMKHWVSDLSDDARSPA